MESKRITECYCGSVKNLKLCGECNDKVYCSKKCQKKDWKNHKGFCLAPECPICMEKMEGDNNKLTTECGHTFHTSCLMTNVSKNGFDCPYCRSIMAEVPEEKLPDLEDVWEQPWEPLNPDELAEVVPTAQERKPTPRFIAELMIDQGFTMTHFVQAYLKDFAIYNEEEENFMRVDDELYERIDEIIQGVVHGQSEFQHPVVAEPIESEPLFNGEPPVFNPSYPIAVYDSDGEDGFLMADWTSDWTVTDTVSDS